MWGIFLSFLFSFHLHAQIEKEIKTLAFGSCNMQRYNQDHWSQIKAQKPDAWVWLGDTIYSDWLPPIAKAHEYNYLKQSTPYKDFYKSTRVFGTWDDHDYDHNNSDYSYGSKKKSQNAFLNFLDEPLDSPRRNQDGVYASYLLGPEGKRIKLILLDLRFFKNEEEQILLGVNQWRWLKKQLLEPQAEIVLIGASTQVLPDNSSGEILNVFPQERDRLLSWIDRTPATVVILSGDRHYAELQRLVLPSGKEVYEFTSSGLTHSSTKRAAHNKYRLALFEKRNFGILRFNWDHVRTITMEVHLIEDNSVPTTLQIPF